MLIKKNSLLRISYLTVLSLINSILNFGFQVIIASYFGASVQTDAFFLALSIPEWILNITLVVLPMTVIPSFSEQIALQKEEKGWKIANNILTLFGSTLFLLTVILIASKGLISNSIASNMTESGKKLFGSYFSFLIPIIIFSSIASIIMGIYYSYESFLIPGLVPIVQSVLIILSVVCFAGYIGVFSAVLGFIIGNFLQVVILTLLFKRSNFFISFDFKDEETIKILKLMLPLLIGNIIFKSIVIVDRYFASFFAIGSISYVYYASKICRVFSRFSSFGISTIYFPKLSQSFALNDNDKFQDAFEKSIIGVLFIVLPIAAFIMVFNKEIVNLLFGWGKFGSEEVIETSRSLILSIGTLIAFSLGNVIDKIFYSTKNTKIPVMVNVALYPIGILMKYILIKRIGYIGVPLGSSIINMLTIIVFLYLVKRIIKHIHFRNVINDFIKILIATIIIAVLMYSTQRIIIHNLKYELKKVFLILILAFQFIFSSSLYLIITKYLNITIRKKK